MQQFRASGLVVISMNRRCPVEGAEQLTRRKTRRLAVPGRKRLEISYGHPIEEIVA